jgi:hypothetical protein
MSIDKLLLNNGYICTNGRWHERGNSEALLSRNNLLDLLQKRYNKSVIKEIVLSIFEYTASNHAFCSVVMYPIIGSHPDQWLHKNIGRVSADYSAGDIDHEIPLSATDASALLEKISSESFDRVRNIGESSSGANIITITLEWIKVNNRNGQVELFINVIGGVISLSKIRFKPYKI